MKNFTYYAPTRIFFGKGEYKRVGEIVKDYGFHKVLVHYGTGSVVRSGLLDEVTRSLAENGIPVALVYGEPYCSHIVMNQFASESYPSGIEPGSISLILLQTPFCADA